MADENTTQQEFDIIPSNQLPEATQSEVDNGKVLIVSSNRVKQAEAEKMKGPKGDKMVLSDLTESEVATLQQPATEAAEEVRYGYLEIAEDWIGTLKPEVETATQAATDAAEEANTAAANVQDGEDGKTTQFDVGTVSRSAPGGNPIVTLTDDGSDEDGNPKLKINLTLPTGDTGPVPVVEIGTVSTGTPGSSATAELIPNGTTEDGVQKYLLNMSIPKGDPGDGVGDMLKSIYDKNNSGVVDDAEKLNGVDASSYALKSDLPEEQVQSDWGQTDNEAKDYIKNKPSITDGDMKKSVYDTDNSGSVDKAKKLYTARDISITGIATGKQPFDGSSNITIELSNDLANEVTSLSAMPIDKSKVIANITAASVISFSEEPIFDILIEVNNTGASDVTLALPNGDGWKSLIGSSVVVPTGQSVELVVIKYPEYKSISTGVQTVTRIEDFMRGINTVTTLDSLPVDKRSIVANVSAATALSLISDLQLGDELNIRVNPSATFTQPIPNTSGWMSMDGDTFEAESDVPFEINIWCYGVGLYSIAIKEHN